MGKKAIPVIGQVCVYVCVCACAKTLRGEHHIIEGSLYGSRGLGALQGGCLCLKLVDKVLRTVSPSMGNGARSARPSPDRMERCFVQRKRFQSCSNCENQQSTLLHRLQ